MVHVTLMNRAQIKPFKQIHSHTKKQVCFETIMCFERKLRAQVSKEWQYAESIIYACDTLKTIIVLMIMAVLGLLKDAT